MEMMKLRTLKTKVMRVNERPLPVIQRQCAKATNVTHVAS